MSSSRRVADMTTEEDLSQMVSTSLTLSQGSLLRDEKIIQEKTSRTRLAIPSNDPTGGCARSSYSRHEHAVVPMSMTSSSLYEDVPGFPDFPTSWCGEEGGAVLERNRLEQQRIEQGTPKQQQQRFLSDGTLPQPRRNLQMAEQLQRAHRSLAVHRLHRQAVNTAGITKYQNRSQNANISTGKGRHQTATRKGVLVHKSTTTERACKSVQKLRHRRQMLALRKCIKLMKL